MDLGINGRNAIVCGSSRGLGKACALALGQDSNGFQVPGAFRQGLGNEVGDTDNFALPDRNEPMILNRPTSESA